MTSAFTGTDRFELRDTLGSGSTADVCLVWDREAQAERALKCVRPDCPDRAAAATRLRQEFRGLARLRHPLLPAVHDLITMPDGLPGLVMEHVPGTDLSGLLPLAPERVPQVLVALCRVLGHLHQQGLLHGDVKPDNVRVTPAGDVKLMDFGLMLPAGSSGGAVQGTLAYLAPEVARQARLDARTDLYALGAVAYHALVGAPPFAGAGSALEVLRAQLSQPPVDVRLRVPGVDPGLAAVVMRLLAKDPQDRFASASAVLEALGADVDGLDDISVLAPPFVGRRRELEALEARLEHLQASQAGFLARVVGPPGIGKTRLLEEWRIQLRLRGVPVVTAAPRTGAPFEVLAAVLRGFHEQTPAAHQGVWQAHGGLLGAVVPEWNTATAGDEPNPRALHAALARLMRALGEALGPAIVIVDDGACDAQSRAALDHLLEEVSRAQVGWVLAARDDLGGPGEQAEVLGGLTRWEAATVVAAMLGRTEVPVGFAEALHKLTSGSPRWLEASLAQLVAAGVVRRADGRWEVPEGLDPTWAPASLEAHWEVQLAGLSPARHALLRAVALAQPDAATPVLAQVLERSEDEVLGDVEALQGARLVRRVGVGLDLAAPELRPRLLAVTPAAEARRWRTRLVEALLPELELKPDAGLLTRAAWHALDSDHPGLGAELALRAAAANAAACAPDTAKALHEAALEALEALPMTSSQREALRLDHHLGLVQTLITAQAPGEAERHLAAAGALAYALDDPVRLQALLSVKGRALLQHLGTESLPEAMAALRGALKLADELGLGRAAMQAGIRLGMALQMAGQSGEAVAVIGRVIEHPAANEHPQFLGDALSIQGHALVCHRLVPLAEGIALVRRAVETLQHLAPSSLTLTGLWNALNRLTDLQLRAGSFQEAEQSARHEIEVTGLLGRRLAMSSYINLAAALMHQGRLEEARAASSEAVRQGRAAGHRTMLPLAQASEGLAAVQVGELAAGRSLVAEAQEAVPGVPPYMRAHIQLWSAAALIHLGQPEAAQAPLDDVEAAANEAPLVAVEASGLRAWAALDREDLPAARLALAAHERGAADLEAGGEQTLALWLAARLAAAEGDARRADTLAEQALAEAERRGMRPLAARLLQLRGQLALAAGRPEADRCFQAMQALADHVGSPILRAQALAGRARALAGRDVAPRLRAEAEAIGRRLGAGLPEDHHRGIWRLIGLQEAASAASPPSPDQPDDPVASLQHMGRAIHSLAERYGDVIATLNQRTRQLEMLNSLARQLNGSLVLDEVLRTAAALTLELTLAERLFLLLAPRTPTGERSGAIVCRAACDHEGNDLTGQRYSRSVAERVVASGEPLAVLDATDDAELHLARSIQALGLRTVMCVPIAAGGLVLGALYVDSQAVVATFTQADLDMLGAIASHVAVAIENASLHERLAERATELERALAMYHEANHAANTDALTGLANRRSFIDAGAREVDASRRYGRTLSVLILDVDHFKQFNDTYGHALGDEVLKAVGRVLPAAVRTADLPARLGGEEFVCLCPETDLEGAVEVAERIRRAIADVALSDPEGRPLRRVTASLGVAALLPGDASIAAVLDRADAALYEAKRGGRNQVRIWQAPAASSPPDS
ncbi:MAG: diguanylate cyclase [Candidatus Sericytochromatia bacterium]|nr:diguanylate cyclase [Candidatus Sericytochromatia bacterium]